MVNDVSTLTIELPEKVYKLLIEKSKSENRSVEEIISEVILKYLNIDDPNVKVELHLKFCEKYLREAENYLEKKDYVQASEKAWGAASQIVKALAAKEEREIRSHRELHEYVAEIIKKTNDNELRRLWSAAGELHRNFYEAWLPPELVKGYIEDIKEFINKMKKLL